MELASSVIEIVFVLMCMYIDYKKNSKK
jgi:hypothetical protein